MRAKIEIPRFIGIPKEYLPTLAQSAAASLGCKEKTIPQSLGQLVSRAVLVSLLEKVEVSEENGSGSLALLSLSIKETLCCRDEEKITRIDLTEALETLPNRYNVQSSY